MKSEYTVYETKNSNNPTDGLKVSHTVAHYDSYHDMINDWLDEFLDGTHNFFATMENVEETSKFEFDS